MKRVFHLVSLDSGTVSAYLALSLAVVEWAMTTKGYESQQTTE